MDLLNALYSDEEKRGRNLNVKGIIQTLNNFNYMKSQLVYRFFLWLLGCVILFAQLNCYQKKVKREYENTHINSLVFKRDSLKDKYGKDAADYTRIKYDLRKANLRSFENGFDSFVVRFWYVYHEPTTQAVEITKDNNGWGAHFFTLQRSISGIDSLVTIISDTVISEPKSGWSSFIENFFALDFTDLPNCFDIPGYDVPMDGHSVNIETATKNYYRLRYYSNPGLNMNIKEVIRLKKAMDLIEQEFGIQRIKNI
jgi:hypothetical protein